MFLLNLTFVQFGALFAASAAVVVALYLFQRSRRKQTVATLRFFVNADQPVTTQRRRRIHEKLSLFLQLASIALLLLAIAQLRLGGVLARPSDHVLVLDTSAWMNAAPGGKRVMDDAKSRALAYVRSVSAGDRVMLVRADGLATAATAFETDRRIVADAVRASEPGATALNLDQALDYAKQTLALSSRRAGEIVFVGAGRVSERQSLEPPGEGLTNFRVISVGGAIENVGIRRVGLRRDGDRWRVFVAVRNYGTRAWRVPVAIGFGGAPGGAQALQLAAGAEQEALFEYRTRAAGNLEVRLMVRDALASDDRAVIELPEQKRLRVAVYSASPDLLRPFLDADPRVEARYLAAAAYEGKPANTDLIVIDGFAPAASPQLDALWIDPPSKASPVKVAQRVAGAKIATWYGEHPVGAGLRSKDLVLDSAAVYEPAAGDVRIAAVEQGPIAVARPGTPKSVVLGFHPGRGAQRFELAVPLLLANTFRWIAPSIFRRQEFSGASAGAMSVLLDKDAAAAELAVRDADGRPLPYTVRNGSLQFFTGAQGTVRVTSADRDMVYSLTLPEVAESRWTPPRAARTGVPEMAGILPAAFDAWPWLALLGGAGLLTEWLLFGRARARFAR